MSLFIYFTHKAERKTAMNISEYIDYKCFNGLEHDPMRTKITHNLSSLQKGPVIVDAFDVVDVPGAAMTAFTDAVMAAKQAKPLDLTDAGCTEMKTAYEGGQTALTKFIKRHTFA